MMPHPDHFTSSLQGATQSQQQVTGQQQITTYFQWNNITQKPTKSKKEKNTQKAKIDQNPIKIKAFIQTNIINYLSPTKLQCTKYTTPTPIPQQQPPPPPAWTQLKLKGDPTKFNDSS